MKYRNVHKINNRYKPEDTKLTVNRVYLLLESNIIKPLFLKALNIDNTYIMNTYKSREEYDSLKEKIVNEIYIEYKKYYNSEGAEYEVIHSSMEV